MRQFILSISALLLLGASTPQADAATHRLMDSIGGEQPIRLQELHITGDVGGSTAETTVQMVFYNPNNRPLEGNLQFPLLPGRQVTAFALDFGGKLRPAVPVEKEKGRKVFEEIERRRVDPALLEVTQGNNFKLRVFPVPAGGTRTVQLSYAETLPRQGGNWRYQLPLAYEENLKAFSLTLNVNGSKSVPIVRGGMQDVKFDVQGDGFQAQLARNGYTPAERIEVLVPAALQAQSFVQEKNGKTYFLSEIPVDDTRTARPLPKVVGLLWDSSGSGSNRDVDAELRELDSYFKAIGNGEVRLTRLRDRPEAVQVFNIAGGDWYALRRALQDTVYDGASALADWKPERRVDEYLLVSDGLLNYGGTSFPTLAKGQRLYALNSATVADTGRLAALAEKNGGRLIAVNAHDPGAAARELLTEGARVVDLDADGASSLQLESAQASNGLLRVAGILRGGDAVLHLTIVHGGKQQKLTLPVPANAPAHPLAATFWASYRLHALQADKDMQRGEIRRLGQEFGIPTEETSLIVLESAADYLRYDIAPPPELQAEYDQLRSARYTQIGVQRRSHLEAVAQLFKQKDAWWEKKYEVEAMPKPVQQNTQQLLPQPMPAAVASAPVAAPPPALVPTARVAPAAPSASPAQRVEVTGQVIRTVDEETPSPVQVITAQDVSRSGYTSAPQALNAMPDEANRATARETLGLIDQAASPVMAKQKAEPAPQEIGVHLKRWSSNAPYIARMKAASKDTIYAVYFDEKPSYANSSAFFLDAADMLEEKGLHELALRVLSNLAEMDLENRQVLRILGYRLMEAGAPQLAIPVLQKVQRLASEEPQSFRDLGLAYEASGQYQDAIDQLNEVVERSWDGRFPEIELIAIAEMNAIIAQKSSLLHKLDTSRIDPRLLKNLPLDLRVVMTWDADASDMDLWVTDPFGEKCFYGHRLTRQGGLISRDMTQGYGPEEFSLRKARPGKYKVEANFYGNSQQTIAGATTLQVKLTTGFGTAQAHDQVVNLRLKDRGETVFVGEFEVKP